MIAKYVNEYFKLERTHEGKVFRFSLQETIEKSFAEGDFVISYSNLQDLKNQDWEIIPLTYETLTVGDRLEDNDGDERIISGASGYGPWRTYQMVWNDNGIWRKAGLYTAAELEDDGYKILPWEDEDMSDAEKEAMKLLKDNGYEIKKK